MIVHDAAARLQLVRSILNQRTAGAGDAAVIAKASRTVYDDVARACGVLIGQVGVEALAGRALHLAQREHPCLIPASAPESADDPFARVVACLQRQGPAAAADAAAAVLAILIGLLVTFIGEPLTARLLREAWHDVPFVASTEESQR